MKKMKKKEIMIILDLLTDVEVRVIALRDRCENSEEIFREIDNKIIGIKKG